MLCPSQLVCSIQGIFNEIRAVDGMNEESVKYVPSTLKACVRDGSVQVRSYDIVTAFTIEPYQESFGGKSPNIGVKEPIQAIMTINSFIVPYPKQNRFSVWFTGGYVEINGGKEKWRSLFTEHSVPMRTLSDWAQLYIAGLMVGATTTDEMDGRGCLSFSLTKPLATNIDLIYMDETMRIMQSSKGTTYVFVRANPKDYSSSSDESYSSQGSFTENDAQRSNFNANVPLRSSGPKRDLLVRRSSDKPPSRPSRRSRPNSPTKSADESCFSSRWEDQPVTTAQEIPNQRSSSKCRAPQRPHRHKSPEKGPHHAEILLNAD
jgi:hypothetical protein